MEAEEVFALLREAERLLEELPEDATDRVYVATELVNLKSIYRLLTDESDVAAHALATAESTVADARVLLASARADLERR